MKALLTADITQFELKRLLGTGSNAAAFSVTFTGGDIGSCYGGDMVLKVMFNWENQPRQTLLCQKYMRECTILSKLETHPNIVQPLGMIVIPQYSLLSLFF